MRRPKKAKLFSSSSFPLRVPLPLSNDNSRSSHVVVSFFRVENDVISSYFSFFPSSWALGLRFLSTFQSSLCYHRRLGFFAQNIFSSASVRSVVILAIYDYFLFSFFRSLKFTEHTVRHISNKASVQVFHLCSAIVWTVILSVKWCSGDIILVKYSWDIQLIDDALLVITRWTAQVDRSKTTKCWNK